MKSKHWRELLGGIAAMIVAFPAWGAIAPDHLQVVGVIAQDGQDDAAEGQTRKAESSDGVVVLRDTRTQTTLVVRVGEKIPGVPLEVSSVSGDGVVLAAESGESVSLSHHGFGGYQGQFASAGNGSQRGEYLDPRINRHNPPPGYGGDSFEGDFVPEFGTYESPSRGFPADVGEYADPQEDFLYPPPGDEYFPENHSELMDEPPVYQEGFVPEPDFFNPYGDLPGADFEDGGFPAFDDIPPPPPSALDDDEAFGGGMGGSGSFGIPGEFEQSEPQNGQQWQQAEPLGEDLDR